MNIPCDTLEGITSYLNRGPEGFHALVRDRNLRLTEGGESLASWLLFGGKMWLQGNRQCGGLSAPAVWLREVVYDDPNAPPRPLLPTVYRGRPPLDDAYALRFVPPGDARCALCGRVWDIQHPENFTRAQQDGAGTWEHKSCRSLQATMHVEAKLRAALALAEEPLYKLVAVPNRYWPKGPHYAWAPDGFEVVLPYGRIVVGNRKRVVSIEWTGDDLFPDCADTHLEGLVHAYTWEVATERIAVVLRYLKGSCA